MLQPTGYRTLAQSGTARELLEICSESDLKPLINCQMKTLLLFVFFIVPFVCRLIPGSHIRFPVGD